MLRPLLRLLPLLLFICSGILLLRGSPILTEEFVEGSGLPNGTVFAWVGISMFPLSILMTVRLIRKPISRIYRFYHRTFLFFTLLALSWGGLSYLLAGNWAFTFSYSEVFKGSEQAFSFFRYYTFALVALPLLFLIVFGIHHLIIQNKKE